MMYAAALVLTLAGLPAAFAVTTDVQVGPNGTFTYSPSSITAAVGDVVNFIFHPKAHTVTQSAFAAPCVPLEGGFDSGFKPVATEADTVSYPVTVNNASVPIWVYCQQVGHCGMGMVFAINPPTDDPTHSFAAFQALAMQLNGTGSSSSSASSSGSGSSSVAASSTGAYSTPPAPSFGTATATIIEQSTTIVTTYTSYAGTPEPTAGTQPQDHKILVGANGLTYTPSNISAAIGDTVTFEFHPKAHSVTQSSFLQPCRPLKDTSATGAVGFDTGLMPVAANATTFPTYTLTINDTAPIWGYCAQQGPPAHCGQGMVFSINAVESGPNNFAAFQGLAKHINGTTSSSTSSGTGTASGSGASASATGKGNGAVGVSAPLGLVVIAVAAAFL